MANFYYVKAGGLAVGDAGRVANIPRVTSFDVMTTANYYDSLKDVFLNSVPTIDPAPGDIICVSHLHNKGYSGGNTTLGISDKVSLYSVDDAAADSYKKGAYEAVTSLHSLYLTSIAYTSIYSKGIDYKSGDRLYLSHAVNVYTFLEDCTLTLIGTSSGDFIYTGTFDGAWALLKNVDISLAVSGQSINGEGNFKWVGGSLIGACTYLFETGGDAMGQIYLEDLDLTSIIAAISTVGDANGADDFNIEVNRVLLGPGAKLDNTVWTNNTGKIHGSSISLNNPDYSDYFEYKDYAGFVSQDTATYRGAGSQDKDGNGFSAHFLENGGNIGIVRPLRFLLASFWVDTTDYVDNVNFTVSFCLENNVEIPTTLDASQLYLDIEHSDGAANALGATVTDHKDLFSTPATHTVTTGEWTSAAANTKQMNTTITVDIGTLAGEIATGVVRVYANLAIDTTDLEADNLLFVCRKVDVS